MTALRPEQDPLRDPGPAPRQTTTYGTGATHGSEPYGTGAFDAESYGTDPFGPGTHGPGADGHGAHRSGTYTPGAVAQPLPPEDDATMALRLAEPERPVVTGGRAERRRAAQRAARARRDSPGVIASRVVGELFITLGVVMLLFVAYQLWWTNVIAHRQAGGTADSLRHSWDKNGAQGAARDAGEFSPGQGFAIIYIPKLDVKAPIAEGVGKHQVLDRGMVGHYATGSLKTAMPWDKQGNFALAGHRNTHGEPFRYVNRLQPGDKIVVETQSTFYTYEMTSRLDQTSPANTKVIEPVPPGSGFTRPGRYITLTTCTPEFTSTYRLVVWGKMVDERPRSKGKPDALVE
ncbi:class E sortase [Streptomyces hesseae]|uniref:Class E sortase n=1 Tax=Streptomyces hesseae TaxID=3075519 RepID=A0ABU2SYS1_9ACTN|nr:class E sortase [Streptomyces sp. DSM 40473]MDT0453074.1 class E sortase [Streptomyces sp. DSM 40473]